MRRRSRSSPVLEPKPWYRTLLGMSTDEELWRRAQEGDAEAFGEVFDRHYRRVFRHSLRVVGSRENAEDVTALVFMEAWRKRRSVRMVNESILAWLLVVTNNTVRNWERSRRRHQQMLSQLPAVDYEPDPADEVSDRISSVSIERIVRHSFARLTRREQEILTLCVLEDLTTKEASTVLKIPHGTVKSRLHRAKSRLADMVGSTSPDISLVRSLS